MCIDGTSKRPEQSQSKAHGESDLTFVTVETSMDGSMEQNEMRSPRSELVAKNSHATCARSKALERGQKDTFERIIRINIGQ